MFNKEELTEKLLQIFKTVSGLCNVYILKEHGHKDERVFDTHKFTTLF